MPLTPQQIILQNDQLLSDAEEICNLMLAGFGGNAVPNNEVSAILHICGEIIDGRAFWTRDYWDYFDPGNSSAPMPTTLTTSPLAVAPTTSVGAVTMLAEIAREWNDLCEESHTLTNADALAIPPAQINHGAMERQYWFRGVQNRFAQAVTSYSRQFTSTAPINHSSYA